MEGSWLRDTAIGEAAQLCRASFLHSTRAGLTAKITMYHAPDVQDFLAAWEISAPKCTDRVFRGAGCCMLAMAFAGESVQAVQHHLAQLSAAGSAWTPSAVQSLDRELMALPPVGRGKRDGRASQFMGVHFLRSLVESAATWGRVQAVFGQVGDMIVAQASPSFLELWNKVRELPRVGKYFGVRIVRLVSLARETNGQPAISVGSTEWPILRTMGGGPSQGFRDLAVHSIEEAERAVAVIRRFFGGGDASHKMRKFSLMHLPCVVCEWHGLVQKIGCPSLLLARIPSCKAAQMQVKQRLTSGFWHPKFHNSFDLAASKHQGFDWWQQHSDLFGESALAAFHEKCLESGPRVECTLCLKPLPLARWAGAARPAARCYPKKRCDESDIAPPAQLIEVIASARSDEVILRECGICMEKICGIGLWAKVNSCEHEFHADCIRQWAEKANTCPLCRGRFSEMILLETDGSPVTSIEVEMRDQRANTEEEDAALAAQLEAEEERDSSRSRSRSSRR